jgi:hypothetical protein
MTNFYSANGINFTSPRDKTAINVTYNGILAKSGADTIYAVCGYGNDWKNESIVKMSKVNENFVATLPFSKNDDLNLAFKDTANNWDNNNGSNYTVTLS